MRTRVSSGSSSHGENMDIHGGDVGEDCSFLEKFLVELWSRDQPFMTATVG